MLIQLDTNWRLTTIGLSKHHVLASSRLARWSQIVALDGAWMALVETLCREIPRGSALASRVRARVLAGTRRVWAGAAHAAAIRERITQERL